MRTSNLDSEFNATYSCDDIGKLKTTHSCEHIVSGALHSKAMPRARVRRSFLKKKSGPLEVTLPAPAYSFSDLTGGLKMGSACTGWCAESQALSQLQIPHEICFVCDKDKGVKQFLNGNLKSKRFHDNVCSPSFVNEDRCDLLVCGAPCQPYSSEGKRGGTEDPRSQVIFPVVQYAERQKPMMILLEQVPAWTTVGASNFTEVWDRLSSIPATSGGRFYNLYKKVLNSRDFGSLQNRKRLYVVALMKSMDQGFSFPEPRPRSLTSCTAILDPGSTTYERFTVDDVPPDMLQTKTRREATLEMLVQCVDGVPPEHLVVDVGTGRQNRVTRGHFPTLTATRCASRDFFSPNLRRRFTLSELARCQGAVADDLNMAAVTPRAMGHIIGNAMSVGTIKAILCNMLKSTEIWPYESYDD